MCVCSVFAWLGRVAEKRPILSRVGRKTSLAQTQTRTAIKGLNKVETALFTEAAIVLDGAKPNTGT